MLSSIASTVLLLPLASAHFTLEYPKVRGFDEESLTNFPCGGQNDVSDTRTAWPLTGQAPIQLDMEHDTVLVEVLMAIGNDPGDNYNVILMPTFKETGGGLFCMGDVQIPSGLGIKAGDNATIQVQTSGDPNGGLYNCADITFTNDALSSSVYSQNCKNGSTSASSFAKSMQVNANQTKVLAADMTGMDMGGSGGDEGLAAPGATAAGWLLGAAALIGALAGL